MHFDIKEVYEIHHWEFEELQIASHPHGISSHEIPILFSSLTPVRGLPSLLHSGPMSLFCFIVAAPLSSQCADFSVELGIFPI